MHSAAYDSWGIVDTATGRTSWPMPSVPLPVVSERLGHSSVRTTADVYAHALRGQDDEAALRWDEFQRRGTGDHPERKLQ